MSSTDVPHSLASSAWRFAIAGGANTLVTGVLLTLLSLVIDPKLAYTVVFAAGIVFATYLADRFVYGVRMGRRAVAAYVAMYLAVYLIGLAVIRSLAAAGLPHAVSGLVVVVTAPLTFLGGRLITSTAHRSRTASPAATTEQAP